MIIFRIWSPRSLLAMQNWPVPILTALSCPKQRKKKSRRSRNKQRQRQKRRQKRRRSQKRRLMTPKLRREIPLLALVAPTASTVK